jgi:hypothetical protein
MEFKIKADVCVLTVFEINGIKADVDDFGEVTDTGKSFAQEYCCGNMEFVGNENPTEEVLKKYKIDKWEYEELLYELKDELYVGRCCMCN